MQPVRAARLLPTLVILACASALTAGNAQASSSVVRIASPAQGATIAAVGERLVIRAPRRAKLACRIDLRKIRKCRRQTPLAGLTDGNHTATVKAVEPDGTTTVAATRFRVDRRAPVVTITEPTPGQVFTGTATARFTANEPVSFTCRVDGGETEACSSPASSSTIPDGNHTLTVSARDAAGNAGVAQVSFVVRRTTTQPAPAPAPTPEPEPDPTPTPEPTPPTSEPTAPTSEPTAPTSEPTAPTSEPTAPTSEPTPPTSEPSPPTGPTEPSPPPPPPPPTPSATALATDHAHIELTWQPPANAATVEIIRRDLADATPDVLIATLSAATARHTDGQLWFSNPYSYTLNFKTSTGTAAGQLTATATTASTTSTTLPIPFKASPHIGTKLTASTPIAPAATTTKYRDYLVAHLRNANLTLRSYGVPVYEAKTTDPLIGPFTCGYNCQLPRSGAPSVPLPVKPKPVGATGFNQLADTGSDHHMSIVSPDGATIWDLFRPDEDNTDVDKTNPAVWQFVQAGATFQPRTQTPAIAAPSNYAAANAANFANLAGLIRPEELALGRIDHALMMGVPGIGSATSTGNAPACPATHNAKTVDPLTGAYNPDSPPEGLRYRLDPTFDVNSLTRPWERTIARAMQEYGVYVRDNSGTVAIYAETTSMNATTGEARGGRGYDGWNKAKAGLTTTSNSQGFSTAFPWNRLEVVEFQAGPAC